MTVLTFSKSESPAFCTAQPSPIKSFIRYTEHRQEEWGELQQEFLCMPGKH